MDGYFAIITSKRFEVLELRHLGNIQPPRTEVL